jgi:hypothetical protein
MKTIKYLFAKIVHRIYIFFVVTYPVPLIILGMGVLLGLLPVVISGHYTSWEEGLLITVKFTVCFNILLYIGWELYHKTIKLFQWLTWKFHAGILCLIHWAEKYLYEK